MAAIVGVDAVGLDQDLAGRRDTATQRTKQLNRAFHPMQKPEAVDEIEMLIKSPKIAGIHLAILDSGVEQAVDHTKTLPTAQRRVPPRSHPQAILLVIDRHYPRGTTTLGQERIEAIERPHVEHGLAREVDWQR